MFRVAQSSGSRPTVERGYRPVTATEIWSVRATTTRAQIVGGAAVSHGRSRQIRSQAGVAATPGPPFDVDFAMAVCFACSFPGE